MGLLSAIGRLFKAIFKKLLNLIKRIFKKLWWVILVLAIIWFAPAILGYLTSIGAPSFLTTAFSAISTVTPYLTSAVSWISSGAGSLISSAWSGYKSLELGTQLAIAGGAAALIVPEETTDVIKEAGKLAGDVIGATAGAAGSIVKGFFSSPGGLALAGLGIWYFFLRDDRSNNG